MKVSVDTKYANPAVAISNEEAVSALSKQWPFKGTVGSMNDEISLKNTTNHDNTDHALLTSSAKSRSKYYSLQHNVKGNLLSNKSNTNNDSDDTSKIGNHLFDNNWKKSTSTSLSYLVNH